MAARRPQKVKKDETWLVTPDLHVEWAQLDTIMERYGIPNYDVLLDTWSEARLYIALDSLFWNSPKEKDHYGAIPRIIDFAKLKAGEIFRALGMWH